MSPPAASPKPPQKRPKGARKGTALAVVLGVLAVLLAIVVALAIAVPRVVASKVDEAAKKRALIVKYGGMGLPLGTATLRDVTIRPAQAGAGDKVQLTAPRIEAPLDGLTPTAIRVPSATVKLDGSVEEILAAVEAVREADAKVPSGERLPVDVLAGTVSWKDLAGDGSSLKFDSLVLAQRPAAGTLSLTLGKGKLTLDDVTLAPLDVTVKRNAKGKSGETLSMNGTIAAEDGAAKLTAQRDDDGDTLTLTIDALPLAAIGAGQTNGVDLRKAQLDGEITASRSPEGALRSEGKLTVSDAKLPPIKASSFTFQIGGQVVTKWKGSPKKGAPGTLHLDEASIEVKVAGRSIVVTIGGDVSLGPKANGPFAVHLTWSLPKIDCAGLVAQAGGGVAASVVTGQVSASGTLDGDPSTPSKLKLVKTIDVGCTVDVTKALPALPAIPGLPKGSVKIPGLR
jgi:hypothetical protein